MKNSVTIYWLIPAEPYRELFREFIGILAKQFDAARFEPHLSLCPAKDRQAPAKLLRQINSRPIRLRVREINYSSKFTKTLFVRFTATRVLEDLVCDLGGSSKSLRDPHVSLLYRKLSAA